MAADEPPIRIVRSRKIAVAIYGFGDASGAGFGSSIAIGKVIHYRQGLWGKDANDASSNYRELRNLVETIEEAMVMSDLKGAEVFIFTDNTVAESAFYKGNSSSRVLFELILRLRQLDMQGDIKLQVLHVAGTRMIAQGTDGLSRGELSEGVMAGRPMLSYIPLHLSALHRSAGIKEWIREWVGSTQIQPLEPSDWFNRGHSLEGGTRNPDGVWIPTTSKDEWLLWSPPPAAADVAIEELGTARHKRTNVNHVFVCPRLMTHLWRKKLFKLADLVFEIPAGSRPFWPKNMHEPLLVGLILRFIIHPPWQLRRHPRVLEVGRQLRSVWQGEEGLEGSILRQLCELPRVLESM